MKIHILFNFFEGPYGGGNQFLKGLRSFLISKGQYTSDLQEADALLVNSHQNLREAIKIKSIKKEILIFHRVDGPIFLARNRNLYLDREIHLFNKLFCDATIFQSEWSRQENYKLGMKQKRFETVIMNAPEPGIFNRQEKNPFSSKRKIRLVATSWSPNLNKGFDTYRWLDEHLDFSRYEMRFVGNSPIEFKNIYHIPPLKSKDLAKELKKGDIFVFASKIESCSNSLLEALHCGLPTIAFNGSSNIDLVKKGGKLFKEAEEIPALLKQIEKGYNQYQKDIKVPSLSEVGEDYLEFFTQVKTKVLQDSSSQGKIYLKSSIMKWHLGKDKLLQKMFEKLRSEKK